MKSLFGFLKYTKWFEWLFYAVSMCAVITLGIVFHSSAIVIISSILGISALFLIAKGVWFGYVLEITQLFFYCTISWFNHYYGEIVSCILLTFPLSVFSVIMWLKNRMQGSAIVKVNSTFTLKEFLIATGVIVVLSVGIYFMLRAFNTASLLISTFATSIATLDSYLGIRRCEYKFVVSLLLNIVNFSLWLQVILGGDISYLTTLTNYVIYFIVNVYGFFNFVRLKNLQKERKYKNEMRQRAKD